MGVVECEEERAGWVSRDRPVRVRSSTGGGGQRYGFVGVSGRRGLWAPTSEGRRTSRVQATALINLLFPGRPARAAGRLTQAARP